MLSFLFEKWSEMYSPLCKVKSQSLHKIYKMLNTPIKIYVVEAKSVDYLLFIFLTLIITCQRNYIFKSFISYYIQSCTIYICRFFKIWFYYLKVVHKFLSSAHYNVLSLIHNVEYAKYFTIIAILPWNHALNRQYCKTYICGS